MGRAIFQEPVAGPTATPAPSLLLFGPMISEWSEEKLSKLRRSIIKKDARVQGILGETLINTMASLGSTWEQCWSWNGGALRLPEHQRDVVRELGDWANDHHDGSSITCSGSSNILSAPLTVLHHVVEFVDLLPARTGNDEPSFPDTAVIAGAQGFCVGFLTAAVVASSSDWHEFARNAAAAVRLALCIGAVVDAAHDESPCMAVAVRLEHAGPGAQRDELQSILSRCPGAYISCFTDEPEPRAPPLGSGLLGGRQPMTVTVTVPSEHAASFQGDLCQAALSHQIVRGLGGAYHHPTLYTAALQSLREICQATPGLCLDTMHLDRLPVPLRDTADGRVVSRVEAEAGLGLHLVALENILCRPPHWSRTVKATLQLSGRVRVVSIGGAPLFCWPSLQDADPSPAPRPASGLEQKHTQPQPIDKIAVIGMGCRFPGADADNNTDPLHSFWECIQQGHTTATSIPKDRFPSENLGRGPDIRGKWGSFLSDSPAMFDHRFFGLSGREARSMDPQQRLVLEVAYETLESAGYWHPQEEERIKNVGVYLGVTSVDYDQNINCEDAGAFSTGSSLRAFISGRVSHFMGWTGPSLTLDTACSSSAVALDAACTALLASRCDMALVGGVNVITGPYLYQNLAAGGFLSKTAGPARAFDEAADGYCRGEGCGLLLLKPLSRVTDGDDVLGVIAASAVTQGSNCSPITVPDAQSQSSLYRRALSLAGVSPNEVSWVEAHGTGTPVGDPVELEGIRRAFSRATGSSDTARVHDILVGSVKDNIGHGEAASGIASIIKVLLMFQRKTLPRQANVTRLSPIVTRSRDGIMLSTTTQPWIVDDGAGQPARRVAVVNNYGAAGSNAAVVLEEFHGRGQRRCQGQQTSTIPAVFPLLLSAKTQRSLTSNVAAVMEYFLSVKKCRGEDDKTLEMDQLAVGVGYQLSRRPCHSRHYNIATTVSSDINTEALGRRLSTAAVSFDVPNGAGTGSSTQQLPVVLCFGGQTGHTVSLDSGLYRSSAILRHHLQECQDTCTELLGLHDMDVIAQVLDNSEPTRDLVHLHCQLFSVQYSTARCWLACGVQVDTVVGHSFGQYAAMVIAGCLTLRDALFLVATRARLVQDHWGKDNEGGTPGAMAAIEGPRAHVDAIAAQVGSVDIACFNGPTSFVLAGDEASMSHVETLCRQSSGTTPIRYKPLTTSHAYHSRLADDILPGLLEATQSVELRNPTGRIRLELCNSPGPEPRLWTAQPLCATDITNHTRGAVHWSDAVTRITSRAVSTGAGALWLEASSGSASPIMAMIGRILAKNNNNSNNHADHILVPVDISGHEATQNLAQAACELWRAGSGSHFWPFHRRQHDDYALPRSVHLHLAPYQFDRSRHWIEYNPPTTAAGDANIREDPNSTHLVKLIHKDTNSALFTINTWHRIIQNTVRGHVVASQSLCPLTLYVSLASLCMQKLGQVSGAVASHCHMAPPPRVVNLVVAAPLTLCMIDGPDRRVVELKLSRATDSEGLGPAAWVLTVTSRSSSNDMMKSTMHATARITPSTASSSPDPFSAGRITMLRQLWSHAGTNTPPMSESPASTSLSGRAVYQVFGSVASYSDAFKRVRSITSLGREAVGIAVASPLPSAPQVDSDSADGVVSLALCLDAFIQVPGIHINCLADEDELAHLAGVRRTSRGDLFLCTSAQEILLTPEFARAIEAGRGHTWTVHSTFHGCAADETCVMANVVVKGWVPDEQDCPTGRGGREDLVAAILGIKFKRIAERALERTAAVPRKTTFTVTTPPPLAPPPTMTTTTLKPLDVGSQDMGGKEALSLLNLVRQLFSDILAVPVAEIQATSTFDELGIDSLLVTEVLGEIERRLGVKMDPLAFQEFEDVSELCARLGGQGSVSVDHPGQENQQGQDRHVEEEEDDDDSSSLSLSISCETSQAHLLTPPPPPPPPPSSLAPATAWHHVFASSNSRWRTSFDRNAADTGLAGYLAEAYGLQNQLVTCYVRDAFASLGCDLHAMDPGGWVPEVPHQPEHARLVAQLYGVLRDAGLIFWENGRWRRTASVASSCAVAVLLEALVARFPAYETEMKMLHAVGSHLAACLSGRMDPLAAVMGDASTRKLLDDVYAKAPVLTTANMVLGDAIDELVQRLDDQTAELRILEIGAGTGATTKELVERLSRARRPTSYTFTDISSSMVASARRRFKDRPMDQARVTMQYMVLDIEQDMPPDSQLLGAFDMVVSTNCIHATRDLVATTGRVRSLLRPGGILCLVEVTQNLSWYDLVWGVLPGWWSFADGRDHAIASEHVWARSLRSAGFAWVDWSRGRLPESGLARLISATSTPSSLASNQHDEEQKGEMDEPCLMETLQYAEKDGIALYADVYYPPARLPETETAKPRPVALLFHGGGHIFYSRTDIRHDQKDFLLDLGFIVVSPDYRKCPEVTLRDGPMADALSALEWVRTQLPRLAASSPPALERPDVRVDGTRVVSVGWSSGGHVAMSLAWTASGTPTRAPEGVLAMYCATDMEDPFWSQPIHPAGSEANADKYDGYRLTDDIWEDGLFDRPITSYKFVTNRSLGWRKTDARARLVLHMNWHGTSVNVLVNGMDKRNRANNKEGPRPPPKEAVEAVSPLAQIRKGTYASPTFLVHAALDDQIPVEQSRRTNDALSQLAFPRAPAGVCCELRVVDGAPHAFDAYPGYDSNRAAKTAVEDGYDFLCRCVGLVWDRERMPFRPFPARGPIKQRVRVKTAEQLLPAQYTERN